MGFAPNSMACMVGGCFVLFCSWLLFNAGSSRSVVWDKSSHSPEHTVTNTVFSAAASVTCVIVINVFNRTTDEGEQNVTFKYDLVTVVDAILAGCVSVTAACNNISYNEALIVGAIGGLVYASSLSLLNKLHIDDPLHVSQVHGFCGLWGLIAVGIFDNDKGLISTGSFDQLGIQMIGATAIISWTALITVSFFTIMKKTGRLRIG